MDERPEQMGEVFTIEGGDGLAGNCQEFFGEAVEVGFLEEIVVADDANAVATAGVPACVYGRHDAAHRLVMEGLGVVAEVVVLAEFAESARRHPQFGDESRGR